MIVRTLEHWRSLPQLRIAEAAAIAGAPKRPQATRIETAQVCGMIGARDRDRTDGPQLGKSIPESAQIRPKSALSIWFFGLIDIP